MAFSKKTSSCSGHSGPRLLLIAAANRFRRQARFIGTITSEKRKRARGHWACVSMIKAIREIAG
jgi:hypothetical protein